MADIHLSTDQVIGDYDVDDRYTPAVSMFYPLRLSG
jgi:hypothetical protein